jgi:hypothetical protein
MCINAPYLLGVGVFPSQDAVQPRMPPWIYNESLVPGKQKLLRPGFPSGYFALNVIDVVVSIYCCSYKYVGGLLLTSFFPEIIKKIN